MIPASEIWLGLLQIIGGTIGRKSWMSPPFNLESCYTIARTFQWECPWTFCSGQSEPPNISIWALKALR